MGVQTSVDPHFTRTSSHFLV